MNNNNKIIIGNKSILIKNTTVYDPNAVIYRYTQTRVKVPDGIDVEKKIQSYIRENTKTSEGAQKLFDRAVQDYEEKRFGNAPTSKILSDAQAAKKVQPGMRENAQSSKEARGHRWYEPNPYYARLGASKEVQEKIRAMKATFLFKELIQKLIKTGKIGNLLNTDNLEESFRNGFEGKVARSITFWLMEPKYHMTSSDQDINEERIYAEQVCFGSYGEFIDIIIDKLYRMVGDFKEWAISSQKMTYGQFFVDNKDYSYDWSEKIAFIVVDLLQNMNKCLSLDIEKSGGDSFRQSLRQRSTSI